MNEINKFIAGLNDKQKKLFVAAVVVVIAAFFDRLLIGPTMSRLSSIEDDISKEQETIKQDLHYLQYKNRILRESHELSPYLTKKMLTDNEMIASFLNQIQTMATQMKINLAKINPSPGEQEADYWKYQADLECSGQLGDLISFMHTINSGKDLMKVDKFAFSGKKGDTDEVKATMTIEKIIVSDKPMPPKIPNAKTSQANPTVAP